MAVDGAIIWMRILARNQYTPVKSEQTCIQHEDFLRASLRFSDRSEWLVGRAVLCNVLANMVDTTAGERESCACALMRRGFSNVREGRNCYE